MIRMATLKLRQGQRAEAGLVRVLELCRQLYNGALEGRRDAWRKQRRGVSYFDQCKQLTELRGQDPNYRSLDVEMTRLTVLRRLDLAFKSFFRRCKGGERPGYPRFKGRDRFDTLTFGTSGWQLGCGKLKLAGLGSFRYTGKLHRDGRSKGLRLVRRAGRWYAQVMLDAGTAPVVKPSTHGAGIDVGIRTFATLSDGSQVPHPRFLRKSLELLARAQRFLAAKKCCSRRWRKAKLALGRLHVRVANRRQNFVQQEAARLAKSYDGFAVEDLDIRDMTRKERDTSRQGRGLRRGIMDSAWARFTSALATKAEEAGLPLLRVNPRGTSQRCSNCGSVVRKSLRDRVHDCAACGLRLDRDENAARNIFDLGWRSAAADNQEPDGSWLSKTAENPA